jgi:hypothetical protein
MALHRDIFWVGRQWAVTGFGVQAIDQRLKGAFDIEVSRLWEDDLAERMHAHAWLNAADFDKALTAARTRFPELPRKTLPLVDSVLELIQPAPPELLTPATPPSQDGLPPSEAAPAEPPPQVAVPIPALQAQGRLARFLPQWRIRR